MRCCGIQATWPNNFKRRWDIRILIVIISILTVIISTLTTIISILTVIISILTVIFTICIFLLFQNNSHMMELYMVGVAVLIGVLLTVLLGIIAFVCFRKSLAKAKLYDNHNHHHYIEAQTSHNAGLSSEDIAGSMSSRGSSRRSSRRKPLKSSLKRMKPINLYDS